jgi:diguanylate cyclase (GGDEF)-like protein/PAS domain S-box-containing protein
MDLVHRIALADGTIRHVHQRAKLIQLAEKGAALAGTVQNVTKQVEKEAERELLEESIARVSDTVMITEARPLDEPGPRIVFVNRAFEKRTGYHSEEVLGRSPRFLQGPDTQRVELDRVRAAITHKVPVQVEVINYTKQGEPFWVQMEVAPVTVRSRETTHFVSIQRDITQRKKDEDHIERLAFFDPLTKLPNRRLLMDRLMHAVGITKRQHHGGALMFIDLDNFKALNDTLGHDKGDLLLEQVAGRLQHYVRKSNTVARFGGDEFVILLEDLHPHFDQAAAQVRMVAAKILADFQQPFDIAGHEHRCTPSIGIALFDGEPESAEDILKRADVAMYEAKSGGRNGMRFFDHRMQAMLDKRIALDQDFRRALYTGEFVLHYQPQVDDRGHLVGAEALVRWNHPQRGLLYPTEFIWLAEDNGLIIELGHWVLRCVCSQLVQWQHENRSMLRLAANVSARELYDPEFLPRVISLMEETGVDPSWLKLEITERVLVERVDETVAKMLELRRRGIQFSLDDFGTGYSSLAYLKKLPLDEIKIDRAFVRNILTDPDDAAISQMIISLCNILHLDVMAEGVENEMQRDLLAKQGCRYYQGYLLGPPVPAALLQ